MRAAAAARDDPDALAPRVDEVPVARGLVALELEPDEHALRVRAAFLERGTADEVLVRRLERDREADPRLVGVDLVVELVAGEDEPRLDAHDVERVEAERREAERRARLPDRVPHRGRVVRVAEDLVAELAAVAGARHDDRDAVVVADPADEEAEPAQVLAAPGASAGSRRPARRMSRLRGPCTAMLWSWSVDGLTYALQPHPLGLLLQPDAVVGIAADEAELVRPQPEDRAVVDHPARLVAERGVGDLAGREPPDVAGQRRAA